MGGAIAEGNFTPAAEFNIWCDPDAAARVFASGLDVTMIGLDVTHRAILGPPVEERLRTAGRIGTFVSELNVFFSRYHAATYGWDGAPVRQRGRSCARDPPGTGRDEAPQRRSARAIGAQPRADRRRPLETHRRAPNAHVGVDLDTEAFFDLLVERIARLRAGIASGR